jgi:hypothetical protein
MLRAGTKIRFTPAEIDEFRKFGVDLDGVRTQADLEAAVTDWVNVLDDERPDLLEKIVLEMARMKGVLLPARLNAVAPLPDFPEQFVSSDPRSAQDE